MKKIPKTIQVDAYTDDDGKAVCWLCVVGSNSEYRCRFSVDIETTDPAKEIPGPDCPIWMQADTGAEAANLCTWWRCAGLDKDPDTEDD
jgi:hypothetical protein